MEYVLLALLVLAIPVLGLVGFFRTLGLSRKLMEMEERLRQTETRLALVMSDPGLAQRAAAEVPPPSADRADGVAVSPAEDAAAPTEPRAAEPEAAPGASVSDPQAPDVQAPDAPPPAAAPPVPPRSLEETIGTRWAVWVGGLALAFGGLFLVRYSIEAGLLGPAARVAMGLLFAAAMLAGGEWMRRREARGGGMALGQIPSAHVPSILTAVGTLSAFGAIYAAHALYDMIGSAVAFVLLAGTALGTMALAAVHGPGLAGLGLLAAFVAPVLVKSTTPAPWPVVLYLLIATAAAYGLARLRHWLWLALSAAAGAELWALILFATFGVAVPVMTFVVLQGVLAALLLLVQPYRGQPDEDAQPDRLATLVFAGLTVVTAILLIEPAMGLERLAFAVAMVALLAGTAVTVAAGSALAVMATVVADLTLLFWPIDAEIAREPVRILPGGAGAPPWPEAVTSFVVFALAASGAIMGGAALRILRGPGLRGLTAGLLALAAVLAPLVALVVSWWRLRGFDASLPFALVAAGLALVFTMGVAAFRRGEAVLGGLALRIGVESFSAGALAALALGLTMVLDRGSLTVALALSALGAAWVTTREPLGLLRWCVGGLGFVVAARLIYDPHLIVSDIGPWPILNWLLWVYGVPAACFAGCASLLGRERKDQVVGICEALALAFAFVLVAFEIRHAVTGSVTFDKPFGHLQAGLQVLSSLLFALFVLELEAVRRSPVLRIGFYVFGALGLAGGLVSLVLAANPLLDGEPVSGPVILNSLLVAYLLPALAAATVAWRALGRRPRWFVQCCLAVAGLLQFIWTVAVVRHLFHGARIDVWRPTTGAELYTYSAVFLVIGLVLLALGILRGSRWLRLLSAFYITLTVLKVFLVDMSGLTGPLRALSFIGLGLVLMGIGLVYQKLIFRRVTPPG